MKVLIERKEKTSFVNKEGQTKEKLETVRKIVTTEQLRSVKALDINVKPEFKWAVIHEFKEGEELTKNLEEIESNKKAQKEKEKLKAETIERERLEKIESDKIALELKNARAEYLNIFNKAPNKLLKTETILEKLEEEYQRVKKINEDK